MNTTLKAIFDQAAASLNELEYGEVNVKLVVHQGRVTKTICGVTRNIQTVSTENGLSVLDALRDSESNGNGRFLHEY